MKSSQYGVHEITDMRELINFKIACLTEAKDRLEKVENLELKALVQHNIATSTVAIGQMRDILSTASTQMEQ
ncbi:hypothetical protein [Bacillus alkalicellulosilyticus]|uniref:hypothetical protein n=1 Tax=Alkalihalobacterium alkalicellulosilyticum TaxID=1912214 RepID=UPI000997D0B7|nr:hypothetical protein [Bacillus alkalicellulosilyticus]